MDRNGFVTGMPQLFGFHLVVVVFLGVVVVLVVVGVDVDVISSNFVVKLVDVELKSV